MSDAIKDGGPAFPVDTRESSYHDFGNYGHQSGPSNWQFGGMTLRDYFAAKASEEDVQFHIHHHFNNPRDMKLFPNQGIVSDRTREQARYQYADAMLAAREAKS